MCIWLSICHCDIIPSLCLLPLYGEEKAITECYLCSMSISIGSDAITDLCGIPFSQLCIGVLRIKNKRSDEWQPKHLLGSLHQHRNYDVPGKSTTIGSTTMKIQKVFPSWADHSCQTKCLFCREIRTKTFKQSIDAKKLAARPQLYQSKDKDFNSTIATVCVVCSFLCHLNTSGEKIAAVILWYLGTFAK